MAQSYVKEDGRARIPIVFDNLIAKHDMPVTIAILIDPGVLKAAAPGQMDRLNRSYEYDGLERPLCAIPARRNSARGGEALQPLHQSQRSRDFRREFGRNLLLHRGLDASGSLSPRAELYWQLHRSARRRHLPGAHPQDRAQTDARFPSGRQPRPQQFRRRLVAGQSIHGLRPRLRRV